MPNTKNPSTKGIECYRRPRVEQLLMQGIQHVLVTVVAGPGYGKSSAVANFARSLPQKKIWLPLHVQDNEEAHFWSKLTRAAAEELPVLAAQYAEQEFPDTGERIDEVLRALAEETERSGQVLFVVDNYECIVKDSVRSFFQRIASASVENLSLILISQKRINAAHITMQSIGGFYTIGSGDLKLTAEEVMEYFRTLDIMIPETDCMRIVAQTEGWPLAVGMIAAHYVRSGSASGVLQENWQCIHDLFGKEYFYKYDVPVQELLVKLSLLPCFSSAIVREIAGAFFPLAQETIEAHIFFQFDAQNNTYSMQKMYREYLNGMRYLLEEKEVQRVYTVAGDWFLANGHCRETVQCFWDARDNERFLASLWGLPRKRRSRETAAYVLDCLEKMEAPNRDTQLHIWLAQGYFLINNLQLRQAQEKFEHIAEQLSKDCRTDADRQCLGEAHLVLADISLLQNTEEFVFHIEKASSVMDATSKLRNKETLHVGNNEVFFLPDSEPGALQRITAQISRMFPISDKLSNGHGYGYDQLFAAEAAMFTCDMDTAKEYSYKAIVKAQVMDQHDIVCNTYAVQLRAAAYQGDYEEMCRILETASRYVQDKNLPELRETEECLRGWFAIYMQDLEKLPQWMLTHDWERYAQTPVDIGRNLVFHGIYLMAAHKFAEAIRMLNQTKIVFDQRGLWTIRLTIYTMLAVCYMQTDNIDKAMQNLWAAYGMSASNGIVLPYVEYGALMTALLTHAEKSDYRFSPEWIASLSQHAAAYAKTHDAMLAKYRKKAKSKEQYSIALTDREKEVLDGMAFGFTREDIAQQMGISVNGVKKHIAGIYNKLGALNRADAIRLAMERGDISNLSRTGTDA